MADLTWLDVVIIGVVAGVGFTLFSYWYSALMDRRNWAYQVRKKPRKKDDRARTADEAAARAAESAQLAGGKP